MSMASAGVVAMPVYGRTQAERLLSRWNAMIARCSDPYHDLWYSYGGRGITVCDEWLNDSAAFIRWSVMRGEHDGLQLDRIDSDGNYEPGNCQYVTPRQNYLRMRLQQRSFLWAEVAEMAAETGSDLAVVHWRLDKGWSLVDALCKPVTKAEMAALGV